MKANKTPRQVAVSVAELEDIYARLAFAEGELWNCQVVFKKFIAPNLKQLARGTTSALSNNLRTVRARNELMRAMEKINSFTK